MKKLFTLFALLLFLNVNAQQWEWGIKTQNLGNIQTAIATDGSCYISGTFQDSCEFNGQMIYGSSTPNGSSILLKLNGNGILGWYKLLNGHGWISFLKTDSNDIYIAGHMNGATSGFLTDSSADDDIIFARLSAAGNVLTYKREGGRGYQTINGFDVRDKKIYVSGTFQDSSVFSGNTMTGPSYPNVFFARYSQNGTLELLKKIVAESQWNIGGAWIKAGTNGNIYLLGYFIDTIRFGNADTTIYFGPYYEYQSQMICFNANGKVSRVLPALSGYYSYVRNFNIHEEQNDPYIIRMNEDGGCNHCCSGTIFSKIKLDGQVNWTYEYGAGYIYSSPCYCMVAGDIASTDQYVFATGSYNGEYALGTDSLHYQGMYFIKMDHNGNYLSVSGIPYDLRPENITNINDGALLVSGYFEGDAYLDNVYLQDGSIASRFIAKYSDPQLSSVPPEISSDPFRIFPNPGSGDITVEGLRGPATLMIYDLPGKLLRSIQLTSPQAHLDLPPGIYLCSICENNITRTAKIIINK